MFVRVVSMRKMGFWHCVHAEKKTAIKNGMTKYMALYQSSMDNREYNCVIMRDFNGYKDHVKKKVINIGSFY